MTIGRKFGQHEPLTTRLHNLVRSYPKGLGVLKEFIQNADDAEADEIVFIIDEQQFDVAGLPDSMQWLHTTPALLIYNSKPFKELDIEGIQNIGESGKSDSVGKIGRFGLGFNACYNVTDVPCFFTRGELHFFDPHFQTVPEASVESPGRCFGADELVGEGWPLLDAFSLFVGDETGFDGTVFRLPFRMDQQTFSSRIKRDAFTVSDALEAVHELKEMGSAILLFLKHVRRLKVEHRKQDGSMSVLLSMQATNSDEITKSRMEVNSLLSNPDPDQILTELLSCGSVYSTCCHKYSVLADGEQRAETWHVVDGFFVDDEHKVLNACHKMIENEEKAIPYAGAAWPLDPDRHPSGRIFCFLPVPMQTNMPVQINGYFDLDDSRQNMFLDQSSHGSARLRVEWNKILLETSVVQAYVRLLEELRLDLGAESIQSYYRAFPASVANKTSWEGWLTAAFYEHASSAPLIRVSGDLPWWVLSETRSLPLELLSVGEALISEGFLPIPCPSLPDLVRNGFSANGINVPQLSPNDLRVQLMEQKDLDCPLDSAPRECLRNRDFVMQIFTFCLSDSPGEGIRGLPLAIDCRGHLRTVGLTESPLYLAGHSCDHDVFFDNPEWFLDPEMARDLTLVETEKAGILEMNSERFVHELAKYVSAKVENNVVRMSGASAGILTNAWLHAVFSRLLGSDLDGLESDTQEIPLIPDQFRTLRPMGSSSTPLLFRGTPDLKRALTDLSVPLVTGVSSELFKLLLQFSEKEECIWPVTPGGLIDTLADQCKEALQEYDQVMDVQRALLDYFSRDESLAELKKLTVSSREKLKALRLFATVKGALVGLRETAYVSQDFTFPQVDFDVVLLDDGPSHRWRGLYFLLDVPELSRSRLIREVLLPSFENLDNPSQIDASSWLRDNLSVAQSENEVDDSDDLFNEVRNAPIILCEDGELRPPKSVYQPESKLAGAVLGDQTAFPDMRTTYAQSSERWLEFFRQLNMPVEPRLADVVTYVRSLVKNTPNKESTERLQSVYDFIKGRVDAEIQDQKELSSDLSNAVGELANIAWIPLRQESGKFICFAPPEEAYARPSDVYFPRVGQLVASQARITVLRPEPDKRARKAMGFPVKPAVDLVVDHFQKLLDVCSTEEMMPNESVLVKALGQIYRFFGGEVPIEGDELDEEIEDQENDGTVDLETKFSDIPCIWDQERKRFWRPDNVFSDNVRYMEPWRRTVRGSEEAIERGYEILGRRQSPTIVEWKVVLEEISASGESCSQNEVSRVIREVVRQIVEDLNSEDSSDGDVLVPTRSGKMLASETVFMADAPWYDSMLDSWNIQILSTSVSGIWGIQRALGIPSMAACINERLIEYPDESDLDKQCGECSFLEMLLRSDELIHCLRRMLRHEGHEVSEYSLSYLHEIHVRCVKVIRTTLYLQTDGTDQLLGDAEADIYWDHETLQAMLAENRSRYFCDDLAGLLNRTLGDKSLQNLAPLVHILRCNPAEMSGVLDDLKVRKYSFDHEEEREYEEDIAPQEFPEEDVDEISGQESRPSNESQPPSADNHDNEFEGKIGTGESEQATQPGPSHNGSTATRARHSGTGQHSHRSGGDRGESGLGSHTARGARSESLAHSEEKRIDLERGGFSDETLNSSRGATASRRQPLVQRRLVSYASPADHGDDREDATAGAENRRLRIGDAAVKIVIEHEMMKGREARSMAHSNPGYDVISEGGGDSRYIEVKGTEAAWGERGVALTAPQFFYARENPDRDHWMYVVEDVFSQTPKVHEIHSPSKKVNRFVFDGGWRQAAESSNVTGITLPLPSPGDEVLSDGAIVGIVDSTLASGRFPLVLYKDKDGKQHRKLLADVIIRAKES